jgi:type II secretory pathway component PulK
MKKGAILITTTWILAILTLFAVGIGFRVGLEIKLTGYRLDRLKALYIAKAGIKAAVMEKWREYIEGTSLSADAYSESWASNKELFKDISVGDGSFTMSYNTGEVDRSDKEIVLFGLEDEASRININSDNATGTIQNFLFMTGMELEDANAIARAIKDRRKQEVVSEETTEITPGKDFAAIEEVLLVNGVTGELFEDVFRDNFTLYGDGRVNINTASTDVLTAVFGTGYPDLAGKIADYRRGVDGRIGTDDDRWFVSGQSIINREDRGMVEVKDLNEENWYGNIFGITDLEYKRVKKLLGSDAMLTTASDHYRATCTARVDKVQKGITAVLRFNKPGVIRQSDFAEEIPPPDIEYLYWHEER